MNRLKVCCNLLETRLCSALNMQHGRAESPMRYIAQGKRSDTLGQLRAQTLRPVRAKVGQTGKPAAHSQHLEQVIKP